MRFNYCELAIQIIFCMAILFLPSAYAAPLILNKNMPTVVSLENYLELYPDPTNSIPFEKILLPNIQSQFQPYDFKFGKNRYVPPGVTAWIRLQVENPNDYPMAIILKGWTDYNGISLYEINQQGHYQKKPSEGFLHWVRQVILKAHENKTLYFQGNTSRAYIYTFTKFNFQNYEQDVVEGSFILGGFLGLAIGLIFYNLFLFISTYDKNYFYYVMTWTSFVFYKLFETNILTRYAFPHLSIYENWLIRDFFVTFAVGMFIIYINSVTKADVYSPRIQKASKVWYALLWLTYGAYIFSGGIRPYHEIYLFTIAAGLLLTAVTITYSMWDGFRPARYLFVGVVSLLIAAITHVTLELIYLRNPYIRFLFPIAGSLEMILQSFALADRYNLIKENEEKIKKELILNQKKSLEQQSVTINSYERFLPKQVLPLLHKENFLEINLADNVETNLAILFSDIRGFTRLSEQMSPQQSFSFINDYLVHIAPIITREEGIIDKYIGDAIMALFPSNTDSAVRAGLKLILEASTFHFKKEKQSIHTGVAIHYGQLVLGVIGSQERMECTVISDAVNITSRLESMNKIYGTSLLITDIALAKCEQAEHYQKRILDKVKFYGKTTSNVVYEIFGYDDYSLNEKLTDVVVPFEKGVTYYQHKDFINALQQFRICLEIYPKDKPSKFYIKRCTDILRHGVPAHWEAVHNINKW